MSLLKLESNEELQKAKLEAKAIEKQEKDKWLIIGGMFAVGVATGISTAKSLPESLGLATGALIIAGIISIIVTRFSTKWQLPFIVVFLFVIGSNVFVDYYEKNLQNNATINKRK